MLLTKYEHACFTLEEDGKSIVVDPGNYSSDFVATDNIIAVVITHEHTDHFYEDKLSEIAAKNPDAILYTYESLAEKIDQLPTVVVASGSKEQIGPFTLEFIKGDHAVIHESMPIVENLGVMINSTVYYPGDSFDMWPGKVKVLALPVAAPWMKISDAIDFVKATSPELTFPTHDAILSDVGKELADRLCSRATSNYIRILEPIEIEEA